MKSSPNTRGVIQKNADVGIETFTIGSSTGTDASKSARSGVIAAVTASVSAGAQKNEKQSLSAVGELLSTL
jgi:hypothetical protein